MEEELVEYSVIFKDIIGYIGIYQITDDGRVYNKKFKRFLTPALINSGYLNIILYKNGIGKNYKIHRLVAETFAENLDNKKCVDHINGNRTDNNLKNLRWATHSENAMNKKVCENKLQIRGIRKIYNSFNAEINKDGKTYTKCFKKLEDAKLWRKQKEIELFGEYAYKN